MKNHQVDWIDQSTHDVLDKPYAGLILEFVATRDIKEGEEIFLHYGHDWVSAWNKHVASWSPIDVSDDDIPVEVFNGDLIVRTEDEQSTEPYPVNVRTMCFLVIPAIRNEEQVDEPITYQWDMRGHTLDKLKILLSNAKPCRILQRSYDATSRCDTYTVTAEISSEMSINMTRVPREAIEFIYRPYRGDQFIENAFRHEIHIPDIIFPLKWKDLAIESISDETVTIALENADNATMHQCRFYLAESLIPNAGVGLFAGVDLDVGDLTQNDVVIHVHDYNEQKKLRCELYGDDCSKDWMIASYVSENILVF